MVEYVEAKIVEAKPAYAYFTHPVFGRVEVELAPLQAIVMKIGEDAYRVELIVYQKVSSERKAYGALLCSPQLINEPVEPERIEHGRVAVNLGHKTAVVEIEIVRVFTSSAASDVGGSPCVAVTWLHGLRLQS